MTIVLMRKSLILLYLFVASILVLTINCQVATGGEKYYTADRILGISFVAANESVTREDITPINNVGATWVSLMPYGFVRKTEHVVHFNSPRQWFGETNAGLIETAKLCKQKGLRIMVKPQIWLQHGEYTGTYMPPDTAMIAFKNSFKNFVLEYARIARELNADMFCIGTEWQNFIKNDPEFWQQLIVEVKKVYSGPLTYAANWDEYIRTPFWSELDFIGVNAYFPLSDKDHPSAEDLRKGWHPWIRQLKSVADNNSKPILFTEYGYRSTVKNASKPWESYTQPEISLENQQVAYQALYYEFWQQPWFAGGFAWKWFHNHEKRGGATHIGFSPQNKPAEDLIRAFYSKPE